MTSPRAGDGETTEPTREQEEAFLLALAPKMQAMMDRIKAELPAGTHFAILVEAQRAGYARVIAASTNRMRMAHRAAEWALSVKDDLDTGDER